MKANVKDFSLWCDFIERGFLQQDFSAHIQEAHFVGATSNPSILLTRFCTLAHTPPS